MNAKENRGSVLRSPRFYHKRGDLKSLDAEITEVDV